MKEYSIQSPEKSRTIDRPNKTISKGSLEFIQKKHTTGCSCAGCLSKKINVKPILQRTCDNGHTEHSSGKCPDPNLTVTFTLGHTKLADGGKVSKTKKRKGKPRRIRTRSSRDVLTRAKVAYEADKLTYVRTDDNDIIYSMPRKKQVLLKIRDFFLFIEAVEMEQH